MSWLLLVVVAASAHPYRMLMAPWTPFGSNEQLNVAQIEKDAAFAAACGVTDVFAVGGAGQWWALQLPERKTVAENWVKFGQRARMSVLVHVGALSIADSEELAAHAEAIGADGITVLAGAYPARPNSLDELVFILGRIHRAAPTTPFYYYHMPGTTNLRFKMIDLLKRVEGVIPTFAGIKYVENDEVGREDYTECLAYKDGKYASGMFAANKDLDWLEAGARSFVLMESYYTPTIVKEVDAFIAGNTTGAQHYFDYYQRLTQINGGGINRAVMRMVGIDLGPPRLPVLPVAEQAYEEAYIKLADIGFFDTIPATPSL